MDRWLDLITSMKTLVVASSELIKELQFTAMMLCCQPSRHTPCRKEHKPDQLVKIPTDMLNQTLLNANVVLTWQWAYAAFIPDTMVEEWMDQCTRAPFTSKCSVIRGTTWFKFAFTLNLCDKPLQPLLIPACISWMQGKYKEIRKMVICQPTTSVSI